MLFSVQAISVCLSLEETRSTPVFKKSNNYIIIMIFCICTREEATGTFSLFYNFNKNCDLFVFFMIKAL